MRCSNASFIKYLLIAAVFSMIAAMAGSAEDWPTLQKKARAKHERFQNDIRDMTVEQDITITSEGRKMKAQATTFMKGEKFRMETTMEIPEMPEEMGRITTFIIHDGKDTWSVTSMTGKKKMAPGEEAPYRMGIDWWGFLPENAEVVGSETIGERDCHIIAMAEDEIRDAVYSKVWMDKNSLIMVQAEGKGSRGGTLKLVFSEFQKLEGKWEVPYKTEVYEDGTLLTSITVKSVEVNTGLTDPLFDPERVEVKGPSMQDLMKQMMEKEGE